MRIYFHYIIAELLALCKGECQYIKWEGPVPTSVGKRPVVSSLPFFLVVNLKVNATGVLDGVVDRRILVPLEPATRNPAVEGHGLRGRDGVMKIGDRHLHGRNVWNSLNPEGHLVRRGVSLRQREPPARLAIAQSAKQRETCHRLR